MNDINVGEKVHLSSRMPKHIAIIMKGSFIHGREEFYTPKMVCDTKLSNAKELIQLAIRLNVPVLTFYVAGSRVGDADHFDAMMECLSEFFNDLRKWDLVNRQKIKIGVLGKWYDLPSDVVESVKKAIEDTKDYDNFFVNFCINYDGQEEIVDACKLIARQVDFKKISPDNIKKQNIKENIYASYFLPPDIIIKTGMKHKLNGFLLWDSTESFIYFADKHWPEFDNKDFLRAIKLWQMDCER